MKQSGINYFVNNIGLDSGDFGIFYTFEEGAGTTINSVSGGTDLYTGILASAAGFWPKPGSGFANGSAITIQNASGLYSPGWTTIIAYEKVNVNPAVLFSSLSGVSGYTIGLTSSNKPYLETASNGAVVAVSTNNYASKNIVSFSYLPNYLTIGLYNPVSKALETESFSYQFDLNQSDAWRLVPSFTGYIDYFLHFKSCYAPQVIEQIMSGFAFVPTGTGYDITTIYGTGVTGYQSGFFAQTGVTGYTTILGGDEGYLPDYSGVFPRITTTIGLTGVLASGFTVSGVTGQTIQYVTGDPTITFDINTGYLSSLGMEKIQMLTYIDSLDLIKDSYSRAPFDDSYNKTTILNYSGYDLGAEYTTGQLDLYWNGVAQANSGWYTSGRYAFITGTDPLDDVTFDLKSGSKIAQNLTGVSYVFPFSGQELYINGVNIVSGLDFTVNGGSTVTLTARNTGISGSIFEYPVVLTYSTGTFSTKTGMKFNRNTSNIYTNGVRQRKAQAYLEGAIFDNLSGNLYDNSAQFTVYGNGDLYWE